MFARHPFELLVASRAPASNGLACQQIDNPATTNVLPIATAMVNDLVDIAFGIHQGIGENRHSFGGLLVVACLLRDIFGNPFRPVEVDSRWLTADVVDLAQTILNPSLPVSFPLRDCRQKVRGDITGHARKEATAIGRDEDGSS